MRGGPGALLRWCVRGRRIVVGLHGPCVGASKVPAIATWSINSIKIKWDENLMGDLLLFTVHTKKSQQKHISHDLEKVSSEPYRIIFTWMLSKSLTPFLFWPLRLYASKVLLRDELEYTSWPFPQLHVSVVERAGHGDVEYMDTIDDRRPLMCRELYRAEASDRAHYYQLMHLLPLVVAVACCLEAFAFCFFSKQKRYSKHQG